MPKIIHYKNVFSEEECKKIINLSDKQGFKDSRVVESISGKLKNTDHRTSTQWNDKFNDCSFVSLRLSELTGQHIDNLEALQILKYEEGQQYKNHCDFFNHKKIHLTENDRIATFLLYLNEDFSGGETNFPKIGVKIKAHTGSVVYFEYSYTPKINKQTLHAGMPVTDGVKYILVSWAREKPYSGDDDLIESLNDNNKDFEEEEKPITQEDIEENINRINNKLKEELNKAINNI